MKQNTTMKAKTLIESGDEMAAGGPGPSGPPRGNRPPGPFGRERVRASNELPRMRHAGPGGMHGQMGGAEEPAGLLSRQEKSTFKDLVILDLLHASGGDQFYASIAQAAINGTDPDPAMIRHFMDEAGKYAKMMPPAVMDLMGKFADIPRQ